MQPALPGAFAGGSRPANVRHWCVSCVKAWWRVPTFAGTAKRSRCWGNLGELAVFIFCFVFTYLSTKFSWPSHSSLSFSWMLRAVPMVLQHNMSTLVSNNKSIFVAWHRRGPFLNNLRTDKRKSPLRYFLPIYGFSTTRPIDTAVTLGSR